MGDRGRRPRRTRSSRRSSGLRGGRRRRSVSPARRLSLHHRRGQRDAASALDRPGRGTLATRRAGGRSARTVPAGRASIAGARLVFRPALGPAHADATSAGWRRSTRRRTGVVTPLWPGSWMAARLPWARSWRPMALRGDRWAAIVVSRFVAPPTRLRVMGPLGHRGVRGSPALFFLRAGLCPVRCSILVRVGVGRGRPDRGRQRAPPLSAAPHEQRSQAFGLAQGRYEPGPGSRHDPGGSCRRPTPPARVIAVAGTVGAVVAIGDRDRLGP